MNVAAAAADCLGFLLGACGVAVPLVARDRVVLVGTVLAVVILGAGASSFGRPQAEGTSRSESRPAQLAPAACIRTGRNRNSVIFSFLVTCATRVLRSLTAIVAMVIVSRMRAVSVRDIRAVEAEESFRKQEQSSAKDFRPRSPFFDVVPHLELKKTWCIMNVDVILSL